MRQTNAILKQRRQDRCLHQNHKKREECKKTACNSSIKIKLILILSFYSVKMFRVRTIWTLESFSGLLRDCFPLCEICRSQKCQQLVLIMFYNILKFMYVNAWQPLLLFHLSEQKVEKNVQALQKEMQNQNKIRNAKSK